MPWKHKWLGGRDKARIEDEQGVALQGPEGEPIEFDRAELAAFLGPQAGASGGGDGGEPPVAGAGGGGTMQVPAEVAAFVAQANATMTAQANEIKALKDAEAARAAREAQEREAAIDREANAWAAGVVKDSKALPADQEALAKSYARAARADAGRPEGEPSLLATLKAGYETRTPHGLAGPLVPAAPPAHSRSLDPTQGTEPTPGRDADVRGEAERLLEEQARMGNDGARKALADLRAGKIAWSDFGVN